MEAAFAEMPLAIFTTLAPVGAGAFIALALAFFTTQFSDDQLRKIDRMTFIPLIVIVVGFAASFMHLASPLNAMGVFAGVGSSPLSNEILVGTITVVLAVAYWIVAMCGKLNGGARKAFAGVVAVAAVVFALFTGMAYMMHTIASWNTPLVPVQMLGFALIGGMPLGTVVLAAARSLDTACTGAFKNVALGVTLIGLVIGAGAFILQITGAAALDNALVAGSVLFDDVLWTMPVAVLCLVAAFVTELFALRGKSPLVLATVAFVLAVAGIFVARLAFYALQLSIGL